MATEKKQGFTHDDKNNISVDWYTPPWVFEAMGLNFDLDPCSPAGGLPWIPAKAHYSLPQDGLALPWSGCVWCNPPYGKFTAAWLAKMGTHNNGMSLVFSRTDCKWFFESAQTASAILFLKGRVSFVDGLGKTGGGGAGCGSMLIAWGSECHASLENMQKNGYGILLALNHQAKKNKPGLFD